MKTESKFRALLDEAIKEAQYEVLAKAEQVLSHRADMLDKQLYQDIGFQMYLNAKGERFNYIMEKRTAIRHKAAAYWQAAHTIYEIKRELLK